MFKASQGSAMGSCDGFQKIPAEGLAQLSARCFRRMSLERNAKPEFDLPRGAQ